MSHTLHLHRLLQVTARAWGLACQPPLARPPVPASACELLPLAAWPQAGSLLGGGGSLPGRREPMPRSAPC